MVLQAKLSTHQNSQLNLYCVPKSLSAKKSKKMPQKVYIAFGFFFE
jgi:hypothetical protein